MSIFKENKDLITIEKPDGQTFKDIKASVQPNQIFIEDEKEEIPLEENDKIYRKLKNGTIETYIVLDRGFHSKFRKIPSHFQAKVQKESSFNRESGDMSINNITISGEIDRVNINSIDNSFNMEIFKTIPFNEIKNQLLEIEDENIKIKSLKCLEELESVEDKDTFKMKYEELISILADNITIITPFISILSSFL